MCDPRSSPMSTTACASPRRRSLALSLSSSRTTASESGRLFRPNAPRSHPQLVTKPCVVGFRSESWMPGHEIRKAFDLVWRLHDTHVCSRRSDLCESAGYCEDQVAARDREDCRYKEREAEPGTPSQAAFRQGPVHRRLLTSPRLDRKSTRLNSSHDQISYAVFCLKKKKKI